MDKNTDKILMRLDSNRGKNTPYFIFHPRVLKENYKIMQKSFKRFYPNTKIFYSLKGNYQPSVCKTLQKYGIGVEISSLYLFNKARKYGIPSNSIIFNSSVTLPSDFKKMIKQELFATILDTREEIQEFTHNKNRSKRIIVGLRLDPFGTAGKLGLLEDEFVEMCDFLKSNDIEVKLLHFYLGTNVVSPKKYQKAIEKACRLIKILRRKLDISIEFIDIGGGFPSKLLLERYHLRLESFARVIAKTIKSELKGIHPLPTLVIEPGRYLVEDTFIAIGTIKSIKNKNKKTWLITDLSTSFLPVFKNANYRFSNMTNISGKKRPYSLAGNKNTSLETLGEDIFLTESKIGDKILCEYCGAYSLHTYLTRDIDTPMVFSL